MGKPLLHFYCHLDYETHDNLIQGKYEKPPSISMPLKTHGKQSTYLIFKFDLL